MNVFIKSFHQITALPPPNLSKVDLANLVQQVLLLFNSQVNEQSVNIQFDDDASCLLMADAGQIEQTIINILKNALEAIADSKIKQVKLHLYETTLSSGRQQLLLDIEDTGADIADHVIEQIFVPFFTTKKNGTGIGLSLSRQIMLQHGGDLQYIKKPKAGGCFRLSFGSF